MAVVLAVAAASPAAGSEAASVSPVASVAVEEAAVEGVAALATAGSTAGGGSMTYGTWRAGRDKHVDYDCGDGRNSHKDSGGSIRASCRTGSNHRKTTDSLSSDIGITHRDHSGGVGGGRGECRTSNGRNTTGDVGRKTFGGGCTDYHLDGGDDDGSSGRVCRRTVG